MYKLLLPFMTGYPKGSIICILYMYMQNLSLPYVWYGYIHKNLTHIHLIKYTLNLYIVLISLEKQ